MILLLKRENLSPVCNQGQRLRLTPLGAATCWVFCVVTDASMEHTIIKHTLKKLRDLIANRFVFL